MPTVSRSGQVRFWSSIVLLLLTGVLEILYRDEGPLPWSSIFQTHRAIYPFAAHFLICSYVRAHARIRLLAATVAGSTWPFSPDVLESTHVVYVIWCPFRRLFYIGKTIDFMARLRRHIYGFLAPDSAHPQPYTSVLCAHFGGDAARALASIIFTPISRCFEEEATLRLERRLIDSMHPPLNEPYVKKLLPARVAQRAMRPHHCRRLSVTTAAATKPTRFSQTTLAAASHSRLGEVRTSSTVAHMAAAACNTLGKPDSGRVRKSLFSLSPSECFAVWRHVRRTTSGFRATSAFYSWNACAVSAAGGRHVCRSLSPYPRRLHRRPVWYCVSYWVTWSLMLVYEVELFLSQLYEIYASLYLRSQL